MEECTGFRFGIDDLGIASIVLDNESVLNALTVAMLSDLLDALSTLVVESPRSLALSAEGATFCAGGNVDDMGAVLVDGPGSLERSSRVAAEVAMALATFPAPTVVGVQGAAFGGGAALALACDQIIAEPGAKFGLMFTAIGVPAGDMLTPWSLSRRVGTRQASRLLLDASIVGAEEALGLGLVDELVPAEQLADTVNACARRWSDGAARALAETKAAILRLERTDLLPNLLEAEVAAVVTASFGPEFREGLTAANQRRKPDFRST